MTDASPQLHGPGGLLGTPGLGARRRKGKWGQRLKDSGYSARAGQTIRGNLARGSDGKFTAAGNASAAKPQRGVQYSKPPKPKITPIKARPAPKRRSSGRGRAAAAKPKAPKATPEQRAAERDAERAAKQTENRTKVGAALANADASIGPTGVKAVLAAADGGPIENGEALAKLGYAEQNPDGSYRLTSEARALASAANRGDTRAALDADGRAQERAAKRAEAEQKRSAAEAKKLEPKPAGGGGSKKPSEADKKREQQQERERTAQATAQQVGMAPADLAALRQAAEAGGASSQALAELGLIGPDGQTTDQGRRALSALERGDVRQYNAALQDAKARMGRETAAQQRRQQTEGARTRREQERTAREQRKLDLLQRRARAGAKLTQAQRDQLTEAGLAEQDGASWRVKAERYGGKKRGDLDDSVFAGPDRSFPIVTAQDVRDAVASLGRTKHDKDAVKRGIIRRARAIGATSALPESWREKAFTVFKDHRGRHRWLARTTTAYRDRDAEIISSDALDADSVRMMRTKQFGPLRYWHVGAPDPFDAAQPWGPGLDIGDCDYSVLIGRTRIESGTFRNPTIAQKVARQADQYELSPGFFHPLDQPDQDGVFSAIRTFERSIVPRRYGRASNLFTGLAVKESRMDVSEMERRFKTAIADLGLNAEQASALGQQLVATEKAAAEQGIAFKSEEQPAPEPAASAPPEEITIGGVVYTVKAAPPDLASDAGAPAVEAKADDDMAMEIADEVVEPDESAGGPYVGDLTPTEFFAQLDEHLAPLIKMQEMVKALADGVGELKSMSSGVATKDAGELARLKEAYQQLFNQIAAIEGRQPSTILPDEVEAAFKSAGPTQPASPEDAELAETVNDPSRPFAAIAARTMPALYKTNPDGGFAGWTPPPAS